MHGASPLGIKDPGRRLDSGSKASQETSPLSMPRFEWLLRASCCSGHRMVRHRQLAHGAAGAIAKAAPSRKQKRGQRLCASVCALPLRQWFFRVVNNLSSACSKCVAEPILKSNLSARGSSLNV